MKLIRDFEIEHCTCGNPEVIEPQRIYLRKINDLVILIQGAYSGEEYYEVPYILVEDIFDKLISSIELKKFVYQVEYNLKNAEENNIFNEVMSEKKEWTIISHDYVELYFVGIDTEILYNIVGFITKYVIDSKA